MLINEAGQVEIDASLITPPEHAGSGRIVIQQLIGGCMCCSSYLPMQVALSRLLSQARPDRLFIEVAGLGHPAQLIQQLGHSHWATALSLRAVLTVVNGSSLHDPRLLNHEIFQAQLSNADIVILSHADAMQPVDKQALQQLMQQNFDQQDVDQQDVDQQDHQKQPLIHAVPGKVLLDQIDVPHMAKLYKARPQKATVYKAIKR